MTDHELTTLLRDHVRNDEPPFLLSADTAMALGRRTLVRRRARRGFTGVLVAAAAVAAIPLAPWHGSHDEDRTGVNPATATALAHYDAQKMPQLLDEHTRAALGAGLDGLGDGVFRATDDQDVTLPARYYDKASAMSVSFGARSDGRQVVVSLRHSRGEAEGSAARYCSDGLDGGWFQRCTVSRDAAGDVVVTSVSAMRQDDRQPDSWGTITRDELRTGKVTETDPIQRPIDLGEVYFERTVKVVHSETFLTTVQESVRAPDLATADTRWQVAVADMRVVATDPELVIPKPPMGDNGCAWMLHPEGVTCGRTR